MAKDTSSSLWFFDAQGQQEDRGHPVWVNAFTATSGSTGGTISIQDVDGKVLVAPYELAADEVKVFPIMNWVDSVDIQVFDDPGTVVASVGKRRAFQVY
ncbi:MAG: hypothetical protein ACREYE_23250 [Gammaproteobacteria bacterium]